MAKQFFIAPWGNTGMHREQVDTAVAELNVVLEFEDNPIPTEGVSDADVYADVEEVLSDIRDTDDITRETKDVLFLVWKFKHDSWAAAPAEKTKPAAPKDKPKAAPKKDDAAKTQKKAGAKKQAPKAVAAEPADAIPEPEAVTQEVKDAKTARTQAEETAAQTAPLDGRSSPNRLKYSRMDAVAELMSEGVTDVEELIAKVDKLYAKKTNSKSNIKETHTQVRRMLNALYCYGAIAISPDWGTITALTPPAPRKSA